MHSKEANTYPSSEGNQSRPTMTRNSLEELLLRVLLVRVRSGFTVSRRDYSFIRSLNDSSLNERYCFSVWLRIRLYVTFDDFVARAAPTLASWLVRLHTFKSIKRSRSIAHRHSAVGWQSCIYIRPNSFTNQPLRDRGETSTLIDAFNARIGR